MEVELRKKIIELFEYRELPKLISYRNTKWDDQFYEDLTYLQYQIYMLDHELETNWNVDMDIINDRWESIYKSLDVLGVDRVEQDNYCRHIYKYQQHELDIRKGKLPTRLSMEYFYFYKSCDVKLLRKIIYNRNPFLSKVIKESEWRIFDLVTEVNDDVVDLQEDISTINGNRFLISMLQYGKQHTIDVFLKYLDDLEKRNDTLDDKIIEKVDFKNWTKIQAKETKDLIVKQASCFDDLDLSMYNRVLASTG